ncbi:double-strand break repair helicase AddA [Pseudogemmobacter sp. W21_MBD1_M6]|uniref:double-strand break repair helicase AddA n=1 Tax=Pseudogemmobacter sp. W21_MBD1_M6 TaxID=3240271 RepID=UPI003F9A4D9B
MTRPDDATLRQIAAADPSASTWLSANAGSGKTRVLTDRVARLLLEGVMPQNILCLTYTKAAASEMQNRLFRRLGEWAMMEDDRLLGQLTDLGGRSAITPEKLRDARTLFARAIETPGGLKIQTIHSFCASLLRRFPLEARVSPTFVEMDDRAAKLLREEIVEGMADGTHVGLIDGIARYYSGEDFGALTQEVTKHQTKFGQDAAAIWALFGLDPGFTDADLVSDVFLGNEASLLADLLVALHDGLPTDKKDAAKLSTLDTANLIASDLPVLESVFLTGATATEPFCAKIDKFPTKATRIALGDRIEPLNQLMMRVEQARDTRLRLYSARKTLALHQFAAEFLPAYDAGKMRHGWLDFDDLILKARQLLTDPAVAQWVLYRLDGGIDHILVDEAQDTSPAQWDVIRLLAQEFTSGEGARSSTERTIFVVGDKKQSIYSFQGADPRSFDRMQEYFNDRLSEAGRGLQSLSLDYSFRSAQPILTLVDTTFQQRGGKGVGEGFKHIAFKTALPGRVDLWPPVEKIDDKDTRDWFDPVDRVSESHHSSKLANQIADEIKRMIDEGVTIPAEIDDPTGKPRMAARRVTAGDFLILVQRRSELFHEIIRACKSRSLSIAGADRLRVGAELAVKDLAALLRFLATPEDDLSLATALRSPLFGWSEGALYDLAHKRGKAYLSAALRDRKAEFESSVKIINELRNSADFLRPYDLLERILTRHDGRKKLLARLGTEAEDGIDALLTQALAYERTEVPSLTGFLTWLDTDEVDIKRQMDTAGDRIRVMTVHGAKGLEAPIVILPDTAKRDIRLNDEIYKIGETPVWKSAAAESPKILGDARDQLKAAQEDESMRLLYVAMTRAEKWLIVCAAGDLGKNSDSWYDIIRQGMDHSGAVDFKFGFGQGRRLEQGDWALPATEIKPQADGPLPPIPAWALCAAPAPAPSDKPLAPSGLGGAKSLGQGAGGQDDETALRRGRQLHRLLEHLAAYPQPDWPRLAQDILSTGEDISDPTEAGQLMVEATRVLTDTGLAHLFTPDALTEVDISAALPELAGARILGAIDRLIIGDDRVLAIDYKSNQSVPATAGDVPHGILAQMGAYAAALSQIFPEREVQTAILWTTSATLMPLPHNMVSAALRSSATP